MKKFVGVLLFVITASLFAFFVREKVSVDRTYLCEEDDGHPEWNGKRSNG